MYPARIVFAALCVSFALSACSIDDDDKKNSGGATAPVPDVKSGQLVDAPIAGVFYRSGGESGLEGVTDSQGRFDYLEGQNVEFSIGGIQLGSAVGQAIVSLDTIALSATEIPNKSVLVNNIARFLLTIDEDSDPSNGIRILTAVAELAAEQNFILADFVSDSFDDNGISAFAKGVYSQLGGGSRVLVSASEAESHLQCSRADIADGSFDGDGCELVDTVDLPEQLVALAGTFKLPITLKTDDLDAELNKDLEFSIDSDSGVITIGNFVFDPDDAGYKFVDNSQSQFSHYLIEIPDKNNFQRIHALELFLDAEKKITSAFISTAGSPVLVLEAASSQELKNQLVQLITNSPVVGLFATDLDSHRTNATEICAPHILQMDDGGSLGSAVFDNENRDTLFRYAIDGVFSNKSNFNVANSSYTRTDEVQVLRIDNAALKFFNDGHVEVVFYAHGSPNQPRLILSNDANAVDNAGCNTDTDKDGLPNVRELAFGTDPNLIDSDGDGLPDGAEVLSFHTDPTKFDTDGDGVGDGSFSNNIAPTPLCVLAGPSGDINFNVESHSLLRGDHTLIYRSFHPLSPYQDFKVSEFSVTANTLTLPDGRVLDKPFIRNSHEPEIHWLDKNFGHEYALSLNDTGVFKEINVLNACGAATSAQQLGFLGQFTTYVEGVPSELRAVAGEYLFTVIERPLGSAISLRGDMSVEIDLNTGVINIGGLYEFDPSAEGYYFANNLNSVEPGFEISIPDPNSPAGSSKRLELNIYISENGSVNSVTVGELGTGHTVLRLESRPLSSDLINLFSKLISHGKEDGLVTVSLDLEKADPTDICAKHSISFFAPSSPQADSDYPFAYTYDDLISYDYNFRLSNGRYLRGDGFEGLEILGNVIEIHDDGVVNFTSVNNAGDEVSRASSSLIEIEAVGCLIDSDGDSIPDIRELAFGTNPNLLDTDGDGLADGDELFHLTHPTNPLSADTDGDGLSDGLEMNNLSSNPNSKDSDFDGIDDIDEVSLYSTDPSKSDTDGDGLSDFEELFELLTNALVVDSDNDGVSDGDEIHLYSTNPLSPDSDGDGIADGVEISGGSNPNDPSDAPDSDGDGIKDNVDNCPNVSNPLQEDTVDGDGIGDACDPKDDTDSDGDSVADVDDNCPSIYNSSQQDDDLDSVGNACDPDVFGSTSGPSISTMCETGGTDVAFVVDRSGSMSASAGSGFDGNRLDMIKNGVGSMVFFLGEGDRSALISYSAERLDKGLNNDHLETLSLLNSLRPDGSTSAEPAINLARGVFVDSDAGRVIIHMTDGQSSGVPANAAQLAKDEGIEFYALGIGDGLPQYALDDLEEQASLPKDTHFAVTQTPEDFLAVIKNIQTAVRGGLELESRSISLLAKGDFLGLPLETLNMLSSQNEQHFRYSDLEPNSNTAGGDSTLLPLPLGVDENGLFSNTVRNVAVGEYNDGVLAADAEARSELESFRLSFAGTDVLVVEAAVAQSRSSAMQIDGKNTYSSSADGSSVARIAVGGQELPLPLEPNTRISIPGVGYVILNEQASVNNGRTAGTEVSLVHLYLTDPQSNAVSGELIIGYSFSGVSCAGPSAFDGALISGEVSEPLAPITDVLGGGVPANPITAEICPLENELAGEEGRNVAIEQCSAEAGFASPALLPPNPFTELACPETNQLATNTGTGIDPQACFAELASM